jgi:hypothetical protein
MHDPRTVLLALIRELQEEFERRKAQPNGCPESVRAAIAKSTEEMYVELMKLQSHSAPRD